MNKIIKKILKETLEDKRLQMVYVYFSTYISTLEEIVRDNGRIFLREYGDKHAKVCVLKQDSICCVDWKFWNEFSEKFSLRYDDLQSIINKWVENTYQLTDVDTFPEGAVWRKYVQDTYKLTGIYTTGVFKSNWSIS